MSTAAIPDRKTRKLAMLVPAATVGHLPRRRSWLPGSRILLALFYSILLLPSFVWVFLDRSVWPWDQAWYGEVTVQLYSTLRHEPGKWLQAMIAAFGTKPPAIAWIGQWFVPFGKRMGSIDLALHLSVLLIQFLTLVMVWRLGREVFPERSRWLPAIGCLFVGSAPLFIGLSHQYFPEPLQNLAVLWIFYIALAG